MGILSWLKGGRGQEAGRRASAGEAAELPGCSLDNVDMQNACAGIVETLQDQRVNRVKRGFYWENQIAFAYNSNKIEGGRLTRDQTRLIFETHQTDGKAPVDDVIETANHFRLFDYMLDTLGDPLTPELVCKYHAVLKTGTSDDLDNAAFVVGGWKTVPNSVDGMSTTPPSLVGESVGRLLSSYLGKEGKGYEHVAALHALFEQIHPFQDGNGRVGRMLAFRECIANGLVPFIVVDDYKGRYYQALRDFPERRGELTGFFEAMAGLYYESFSSLLPEHLLLNEGELDNIGGY